MFHTVMPASRISLLDLHETFGRSQVRGRPHADVLGSELLQKEQLFVGWFRRRLNTQFDAGGFGRRSRGAAHVRCRSRGERAERETSKIAAIDRRVGLLAHNVSSGSRCPGVAITSSPSPVEPATRTFDIRAMSQAVGTAMKYR